MSGLGNVTKKNEFQAFCTIFSGVEVYFWSLKNHSKKSTSTYKPTKTSTVTQRTGKDHTLLGQQNSRTRYEENSEMESLVPKAKESSTWHKL